MRVDEHFRKMGNAKVTISRKVTFLEKSQKVPFLEKSPESAISREIPESAISREIPEKPIQMALNSWFGTLNSCFWDPEFMLSGTLNSCLLGLSQKSPSKWP